MHEHDIKEIDAMDARARRHLGGIRINPDVVAENVISLVRMYKQLRVASEQACKMLYVEKMKSEYLASDKANLQEEVAKLQEAFAISVAEGLKLIDLADI